MPELPEVETVRRGLQEHVESQIIHGLIIRQPKLRYPVDIDLLKTKLLGQTIQQLRRRAKYLLFEFAHGTLLIHLGMTGVMRVLPLGTQAEKHDHADLILADCLIRFNDVRRFGAILWLEDPSTHPLLQSLGPEPLSEDFNAAGLAYKLKATQRPIKLALMDQKIVVGVGNIYANEALFASRIHPQKPSHLVTLAETQTLVKAVKSILTNAISHGGTSLKDFLSVEGKPGYFRFELKIYGRKGEGCGGCGAKIQKIVLGQRATYFCPQCQTS